MNVSHPRYVLASMVLASTLLLTGCATTAATPSEAPADPVEQAELPELETPDPAAEEETLIKAFGETFTWEDDVAVVVSAPTAFTPSDYVVEGEQFSQFVAFDVTVNNGSDAAIDGFAITTTAQSGGVEGAEVFDSANGFEGGPSSTILPGDSITYRIGYGVADPAAVTLAISPSWEHSEVYYRNS